MAIRNFVSSEPSGFMVKATAPFPEVANHIISGVQGTHPKAYHLAKFNLFQFLHSRFLFPTDGHRARNKNRNVSVSPKHCVNSSCRTYGDPKSGVVLEDQLMFDHDIKDKLWTPAAEENQHDNNHHFDQLKHNKTANKNIIILQSGHEALLQVTWAIKCDLIPISNLIRKRPRILQVLYTQHFGTTAVTSAHTSHL